jgi:hypothetical protein
VSPVLTLLAMLVMPTSPAPLAVRERPLPVDVSSGPTPPLCVRQRLRPLPLALGASSAAPPSDDVSPRFSNMAGCGV